MGGCAVCGSLDGGLRRGWWLLESELEKLSVKLLKTVLGMCCPEF